MSAEQYSAELDAWVSAKRQKDFATADRIREDLRAKGIDPDTVRPAHGAPLPGVVGVKRAMPGEYDPQTEAELDRWLEAKRGKDFATADRLREGLRARGVSPDRARPLHAARPVASGGYGAPPSYGGEPSYDGGPSYGGGPSYYEGGGGGGYGPPPGGSGGYGPPPGGGGGGYGPPGGYGGGYGPPDGGGGGGGGYGPPGGDGGGYGGPPGGGGGGYGGGYGPPGGGGNWWEDAYQTPATMGSLSGGPGQPAKRPRADPAFRPPTFDPHTESQLDEWVSAKRAKDFARADALRVELRACGIDPDKARPSQPIQYDPTEAQLDAWVSAKRQKDFPTADRIRENLRARGIDPDTARPK